MANGYTFVAPSDWGVRTSPGELQRIINNMVQAQADLNARIGDWDGAQSGFRSAVATVQHEIDYNKKIRDHMKDKLLCRYCVRRSSGALHLTLRSV